MRIKLFKQSIKEIQKLLVELIIRLVCEHGTSYIKKYWKVVNFISAEKIRFIHVIPRGFDELEGGYKF